jgi:CII-binding regulator of phage lambda lysogenization HflD
MSANEIGEFLRANGLHSSDLDSFKETCLSSFQTKGRPKIDPEVTELRKSKKTLERSLKRTESALAEQSARIILLKKSHEIWGEPEDDE